MSLDDDFTVFCGSHYEVTPLYCVVSYLLCRYTAVLAVP
jgi:hypothetical protein